VPKGDRRADRSAQDAVLTQQMTAILADSGKKMAAGAYQTLIEMTGFDLRTFSNSIEKLISYTGDSKEITAADVETLPRTLHPVSGCGIAGSASSAGKGEMVR